MMGREEVQTISEIRCLSCLMYRVFIVTQRGTFMRSVLVNYTRELARESSSIGCVVGKLQEHVTSNSLSKTKESRLTHKSQEARTPFRRLTTYEFFR